MCTPDTHAAAPHALHTSLLSAHAKVCYVPADISDAALSQLAKLAVTAA